MTICPMATSSEAMSPKQCTPNSRRSFLLKINFNILPCPAMAPRAKIYDNRKYYNQVHNLLKLGAFKPVPHFPVSVSDLWPPLLKELRVLDKRDRNFVLKQAVGRIFEDVNSKLYHSSISRVLEVRLVD